jgi:hypothetical protein
MVNFKTTKDSYKSKRYSFNPPEKWLIVEDYYPPIVDKQTWELAQKLRKTRRKKMSLGAPNPLSGILFCGECGAKIVDQRMPPTRVARYCCKHLKSMAARGAPV